MYFFILLHSANYMGKYVTCLLYLIIKVSTSLFLYHDTQYCQSERFKSPEHGLGINMGKKLNYP